MRSVIFRLRRRNYVLQSIVYQIMCKCHHGKSFFFSLWDSVGCLLMMGGALNTKNLIIHSFHFSLFVVVYIPNIQLFPSHWLELITRCGFFGGIIIASFLFWWTGVRLFRMSCWLTIKHDTIRDQQSKDIEQKNGLNLLINFFSVVYDAPIDDGLDHANYTTYTIYQQQNSASLFVTGKPLLLNGKLNEIVTFRTRILTKAYTERESDREKNMFFFLLYFLVFSCYYAKVGDHNSSFFCCCWF